MSGVVHSIKAGFTPTEDEQGNKVPGKLQQGIGRGLQQGFQNQQNANAALRQGGNAGWSMPQQPQVALPDYAQAFPPQWSPLVNQPRKQQFYGE